MLITLGVIREILGSGSIFGAAIMGDWFTPWMVMILPPGAFLTLGILIALANWFNDPSSSLTSPRSKDKGAAS